VDENHHLLVKLSCKSACENLDVQNLQYAYAANVAVVIVAAIMIAFLYLHASGVGSTNTRLIEAE